ncbi:MAG: Protein TolB [Geminicoccaceae bacterium]|nr:Protein TolB [Geminicoccaceae bacterium]
MSRTIQFPPVAHMVADLDDLEFGAPVIARQRRSSMVGLVKSMMRRLLRERRVAAHAIMSALLLVLIACSDANAPVTPPPVASVSVSPSAAGLSVGQTVELQATLKDASGKVLTGRPIQWSTSSTAVATVSSAGVVTAVSEGVATISARSEGKTGQAQVTVARVPVARVAISPTGLVLHAGESRQLAAVAYDADDNVLEGRFVQWSTHAPTVLTVSETGLVTALARGYGDVEATVEGKSFTIAVTVMARDPEPTEEFQVLFERRPFNGGGDVRRLSLVDGSITALPLAAAFPGAFLRDVTPSPDGLRVAFTIAWYPEGESEMDGDIYVANIDGTGLRRLTTAPFLDDQAAWSPDGTRIAFRSKRSGNWDIWVMGANGTGQVNLMTDMLPATSTDHTPSWSPDGSRIMFSSDIDHFAYAKLWTMRPDGSDKRRVLPQSVGTTDIELEASWSPDGTRIAYRRISGIGLESDIAIATIATGHVSRIALEGPQGYPAWSPDGTRIAFASSHAGLLSHIFTMKADGSEIIKHTAGADENTKPRWLRMNSQ